MCTGTDSMGVREEREFVAEHASFVRKVAARIRAELDLVIELDDLVGYGYRGLLEARGRYDPSRGVQFKSYAHYRVRGAIIDGVRQMARLPRRAHATRKAAEAFDAVAESVAEARATAGEQTLGATLGAIDSILSKYTAAYVIAAVGQHERAPEGPERAAILGQDRDRVLAALDQLPERERKVIEGFYFQDRSLEEIGSSLGISKSWCSRLHTRALGILRDALESRE